MLHPTPRVLVALLCAGALAALVSACGGGSSDALVAGGATARRVEARSPLDGPYPQYEDGLNSLHTVLGTPDLGVGVQRVTLVLSDEAGQVRTPAVRVRSFFFADGPRGMAGDPVAETLARFYEFPEGLRGLYSTSLTFDRAGTWGIEAGVAQPDGSVTTTLFTFEVASMPRAPAVGELAPRSRNRTSADTPVAELTTGVEFDAGLYRLTIDEAVALGRPTVVVFASPGFCTNALCGPQVELLSALRDAYGPDASYVHVELYENPSEIRSGGLDVARRTPVLQEWGLTSDEWTFILDGDGVVRARFEGFAPLEELVPALEAVLSEAGERHVRRAG
jgi:hypothetical protein